MTTKEMINVMQAYERGEQIEGRELGSETWLDSNQPFWDWRDFDYRIKPKPKYRPYKNAQEFLAAQKEHGMWLKMKDTDCYLNPVCASKKLVHTIANPICVSMKNGGLYFDTYMRLLNQYVWQDGTPCGVREE